MAVTTKNVTQATLAWRDSLYSYASASKLLAGGSTVLLGSFPQRGGEGRIAYSSTLAVPATSMESGDGVRFTHVILGEGYDGPNGPVSVATDYATLGWSGLTAATWIFTRTHRDIYQNMQSYLATVSNITYTEGGTATVPVWLLQHRSIGIGLGGPHA